MIICGDCREILPTLPATSVQCCVTSPPYWGLRDYGTAQWEGGGCALHSLHQLSNGVCIICGARRIDSQLGLEATPEEYITKMVAVFREVWRVLRNDGTLWLNLGDSYATQGGRGEARMVELGRPSESAKTVAEARGFASGTKIPTGLKPKDLCGIPWRLAFALQADGWYLRSDIIWHKPNPMPESVTDRPTKAHEYIFLLTKNGGNPLIWRARDTGEWSYNPDLRELIMEKDASRYYDPRLDRAKPNHKTMPNGEVNGIRPRDTDNDEPIPRWKGFDYFYDAEAIREKADWPDGPGNIRAQFIPNQRDGENANLVNGLYKVGPRNFRNKRTVWTIATQPYSEAHFATFPEEIPKLCILAGSKPGDTILDPFGGSGTVGKVALELGRKPILIELSREYVRLIEERTYVTPGFF